MYRYTWALSFYDSSIWAVHWWVDLIKSGILDKSSLNLLWKVEVFFVRKEVVLVLNLSFVFKLNVIFVFLYNIEYVHLVKRVLLLLKFFFKIYLLHSSFWLIIQWSLKICKQVIIVVWWTPKLHFKHICVICHLVFFTALIWIEQLL